MKAIFIKKCFDECPWLGGPDYNKEKGEFQFHCFEIEDPEIDGWIENPDVIPEWCPLESCSEVYIYEDASV